MCPSETSRYRKGGESLGDEESSKEEEVVPSLILASGVRPLAPDVKSYLSAPTSHAHRARAPKSTQLAETFNEAPRSKLRGITELKQSALPEIFLRLPLPRHIPLDGLPVCPFPSRGHRVPVAPKRPTPQYPLHRRLSATNLPGREALE